MRTTKQAIVTKQAEQPIVEVKKKTPAIKEFSIIDEPSHDVKFDSTVLYDKINIKYSTLEEEKAKELLLFLQHQKNVVDVSLFDLSVASDSMAQELMQEIIVISLQKEKLQAIDIEIAGNHTRFRVYADENKKFVRADAHPEESTQLHRKNDEHALVLNNQAIQLQKHIKSFNQYTKANIYALFHAGTNDKKSIGYDQSPLSAFFHDPLCDRQRLSRAIIDFLPRKDEPELTLATEQTAAEVKVKTSTEKTAPHICLTM